MFNVLDNKIIKSEYEKDNYFIVNSSDISSKLCVIYFSSNDIWYPNTEREFIDSVIVSNRYEWKNLRIHNAQKEIFIRDIYKSWYVLGINSKLNTIDAVISFLKKETVGYKIVTVGSSAGGYMAALTASLLDAKYSICFSPQFDITSELKKNPILQKYQKDDRSKYYSIDKYIKKSNTVIYYFYPYKNPDDFQQSRYVERITQVHTISFVTARHGVILPGKCVLRLINMDMNELQHIFEIYRKKKVSPVRFTIQLIGLWETFQVCLSFLGKIISQFTKYMCPVGIKGIKRNRSR